MSIFNKFINILTEIFEYQAKAVKESIESEKDTSELCPRKTTDAVIRFIQVGESKEDKKYIEDRVYEMELNGIYSYDIITKRSIYKIKDGQISYHGRYE